MGARSMGAAGGEAGGGDSGFDTGVSRGVSAAKAGGTTTAAPAAGAARPAGGAAAGSRAGGKRGSGMSLSALGPQAGVPAAARTGGGGAAAVPALARDAEGYPLSWTKGPHEVQAVKDRIYGLEMPRGHEVAQGRTSSEILAEKAAREGRKVSAQQEGTVVPGGAGLYALAWAGVSGQTGLMTKWYSSSKQEWGVLRREADSIVQFYGVDWRAIKPLPGAPAAGTLALAQAAATPAAARPVGMSLAAAAPMRGPSRPSGVSVPSMGGARMAGPPAALGVPGGAGPSAGGRKEKKE